MLDLIDKNCKTALSAQVSVKLINDIRSGMIKPGKRMPGERRLAERFGISRGTVIEALDLLEGQNYIERIPAKGTFVADDVNHELSVIKIAIPFPEASISPASLGGMRNWETVSKVYSGLIEIGRSQNAEISFIHFEEAATEIQFSRQLRRLENIDAAVFIGSQLKQLRQHLVKNGKFCVSIKPSFEKSTHTVITSDFEYTFTQLAVLAKKQKYKRLRVISKKGDTSHDIAHEKILLKAFEQVGIESSHDWCYHIDDANSQSLAETFANFDLKGGNDIVYCPTILFVPVFYRYCFDNNIKLGSDIGVFGHAGGMTFDNLMPSFTYSKINRFEMGRRACEMCIEAVRNDKRSAHLEVVKSILIRGESV